jgi:hypothetical protein
MIWTCRRSRRHFAPAASAGSVTAVSADEVEGDLAQQGEVAGGGAVAHAAVILAEGDVENPVQGIRRSSAGGAPSCITP